MGDAIEKVESGTGDGLERPSAGPSHPDRPPDERNAGVSAAIVAYSAVLALGTVALAALGARSTAHRQSGS